ncbi:hypothetical protein BAZO_14314 [Schinkia azotoformans LMG 9581]|uniref:Uncharacterized protein n=1 Tax=Schinkia azotoformans LMG 9581 TaxID=1131731 RepID=K6CVD9_SCHAZ|nr:hypothetical protein BAZO_14314 [Schinkia azotoformans LMG 9581]
MAPSGYVAIRLDWPDFFIPRKDRRKGFLAFMVFQAIIWLCDISSFTYGLLSAPIRVLLKATDLSITINYVFKLVYVVATVILFFIPKNKI